MAADETQMAADKGEDSWPMQGRRHRKTARFHGRHKSHHRYATMHMQALICGHLRFICGHLRHASNSRNRGYWIPSAMYLISTNESIPYFDPSRPTPDCFTPPKGDISLARMPTFTPTMPVSSASATRITRPTSRA